MIIENEEQYEAALEKIHGMMQGEEIEAGSEKDLEFISLEEAILDYECIKYNIGE